MADLKKAIADTQAMRHTHVEWLKHIGSAKHMDTPKCVPCAEQNMAAIVGDAAHHEDCIARYDNILAALRAS